MLSWARFALPALRFLILRCPRDPSAEARSAKAEARTSKNAAQALGPDPQPSALDALSCCEIHHAASPLIYCFVSLNSPYITHASPRDGVARRSGTGTMNDATARPNSLPWPPIIFLATIAHRRLFERSLSTAVAQTPPIGYPLCDRLADDCRIHRVKYFSHLHDAPSGNDCEA
jgi:hypothetical protein